MTKEYLTYPVSEDILYGQTFTGYVNSFISQTHAELHDTPEKILSVIEDIWNKKGFLYSADLTEQLVDGYLPNSSKEMISMLHAIEDARHDPDPLTAGERKQHSAHITGSAHLYAQTTGENVIVAEGDFSNMAGTNDVIKSLKEAAGEVIDERAGWAITDKAARITVGIAKEEFQKELNVMESEGIDTSKASIHVIRSGGDEFRIIVAGMSEERGDKLISEKIHPAIETFTAKANLHDHKHTKHPKDPNRNGFGAALAVFSLNKQINPATIISEADDNIKAAKVSLGYLRKGEVAGVEVLREVLMEKVTPLDKSKTLEETVDGYVDRWKEKAQKTAEYYNSLKPKEATFANPDKPTQEEAKALLAAMDNVMDNEYGRFLQLDPPRTEMPFENIAVEHKFFEALSDTRLRQLDVYLEVNNIAPTNEERFFLDNLISGHKLIDPPTKAKMPTDIQRDAAKFAEDAAWLEYNKEVMSLFEKAQVSPMTHALHIEFGGIGAVNDHSAFSHIHADVLLKEMADIIRDVLKENKLEQFAEENLYHEGGGKFKLLLPSYTPEAGIIDAAKIGEINNRIAYETQRRINNIDIKEFFKERGLEVGELDDGMDKMSDIPSSKRDWEKGVDLLVTPKLLDNNISGGQNIYILSELAEINIQEERLSRKVEFMQETNTITKEDISEITGMREELLNKKIILQTQVERSYGKGERGANSEDGGKSKSPEYTGGSNENQARVLQEKRNTLTRNIINDGGKIKDILNQNETVKKDSYEHFR